MVLKKKLYRSKDKRMVAGIFGGLGEYFDVDPTLLRLGWVIISALTGFILGIIAYIIAILIIPEEPRRS